MWRDGAMVVDLEEDRKEESIFVGVCSIRVSAREILCFVYDSAHNVYSRRSCRCAVLS